MGLMKRLARGGIMHPSYGLPGGGANLYVKFTSQISMGPLRRFGQSWAKGYTSEVGAFVMSDARQSIRFSSRTATPGKPPHAHYTTRGKRHSPLKHGIFFAPEAGGVVIGPIAFAGHNYDGVTGAQLLEEGGTRVKRYKDGRARVLHYRAFPYMKPALAKGIADYQRKAGGAAAGVTIGPGAMRAVGPAMPVGSTGGMNAIGLLGA